MSNSCPYLPKKLTAAQTKAYLIELRMQGLEKAVTTKPQEEKKDG